MKQRTRNVLLRYILLTAAAAIMLYPLLWMVSASFQSNSDIFSSSGIIPHTVTTEGWKQAFASYGGQIDLLRALCNTYLIAVPKVILTLFSITLTAYGFARFRFAGKRLLTGLLYATLFLPQTVLYVPQFLIFDKLHLIDSPYYLPLILPAALGGETVLIVMLIQFFRSIPRNLDEAAALDGCNTFPTLVYILIPQLKPVLLSCGILQLLWTMNDYMGPLLYVKTPSRYPVSVFVKLSMDADSGFAWNRVLAVCCIAMLPQILIYYMREAYLSHKESRQIV